MEKSDLKKLRQREADAIASFVLSLSVWAVVTTICVIETIAANGGCLLTAAAFFVIGGLHSLVHWCKMRSISDVVTLAEHLTPATEQIVVLPPVNNTPPAKKMKPPKPPKCECVSLDFVILPDDFDGRCAKCGKQMRRFVWLDLEESE